MKKITLPLLFLVASLSVARAQFKPYLTLAMPSESLQQPLKSSCKKKLNVVIVILDDGGIYHFSA